MKIAVISILCVLLITGCKDECCTFEVPKETKRLSLYRTLCIDNVVYISYDRGITVAFNDNGTIKTCGLK